VYTFLVKGKVARVATVIVLLASLAINFLFFQKIQTLEEPYKVIEVLDGDTFVLSSNQSVRLGNFEAPELEYCGGKEAKERLSELILGQTVRLDIFTFDRFRRPVALVYLSNKLVNQTLMQEGLGRYEGTPSKERAMMKEAYDRAKEYKLGIFANCVSDQPDKSNCLIKGNIDRHYKIKTYHFPSCSEYNSVIVEKDLGENWFCSELAAEKAGYTKAKNCFGRKYTL
jgi:endonuclease YncB( thermonuclease family)